jgi:hypothetical protein
MKKRFLSYAKYAITALLSLWVSCALTCNLSIKEYYVHDEALAEYDTIHQAIIYWTRCLSQDRLLLLVLAVAVFQLLRGLSKLQSTGREKVLAGVFAVCFSAVQLLSRSYQDNNSWNAVFGSNFILMRSAMILGGEVILCFCLILYAFRWVDRAMSAKSERKISSDVRFFFVVAAIFLVCWLPYYIFFFPGTANADTTTQIVNFFGKKVYTASLSSLRADDIYMTNHYPYFTTLLFGAFAKLGLWLGDLAYGVAIYCGTQLFFMAFLFAGIWLYLRKIGLGTRWIKIGVLINALLPIYPLHLMCMLKDTLFSVICLVLTLLLFEIVRTKGAALQSPLFVVLLFVLSILAMLTRNQGAYLIVIIAVFYLIVYHRYWLPLVVGFVVPVLLYQLVWVNVLLPAWNVAPGGKQEALGLLFQQTARYVVTYPEEVTEEEASAIRAVIDYDRLEELYNPILADPVKYTYNQDATDEELSAYYQVWFEMLKKHPDAYVQALVNNCYGAFYLDRTSSLVYTSYVNSKYAEEGSELFLEGGYFVKQYEGAFKQLIILAQRVPVLGLLFSMAFYVWLVLFVFLDAIRRKKYTFILPQLLAIISVGVLLMAPANGNFRYPMPLFFMAPFLLLLHILPEVKKEQQEPAVPQLDNQHTAGKEGG